MQIIQWRKLKVNCIKVAAHTDDDFNNLADNVAKIAHYVEEKFIPLKWNNIDIIPILPKWMNI